jgi:hypothetical protein
MNFFCVLLCLLWFKIFKNNFVVYQPMNVIRSKIQVSSDKPNTQINHQVIK